MPWLVSSASAFLLVALLLRWWTRHARLGLDAVVLQGANALGVIGVAGTLLAALGQFRAVPLATALTLVALAVVPWRQLRRARESANKARSVDGGTRSSRPMLAVLFVVVALGGFLRLPTIPAPLAGRDQGTYALRGAHTARTGRLPGSQ